MESVIEALKPHEWERYRNIRLRALRDCPDAFGSTLENELQFSEIEWTQRLERPDVANFVARSSSGPDVGLITGAPYNEDAGLYSMWTAPEARRSGIGSLLIDAVIEWAREKGYRKILLDVGDWNVAAIGLYASKGFVPTGVVDTLPPPREHIPEHQRELVL